MKKSLNVLTGLLIAIATITAAATTIVGIQQQLAYAITPVPCTQCSKEFAPGQVKIEPVPCGSCGGDFGN